MCKLSCHRFGDPVTANCSVQRKGFPLLGWEVSLVRESMLSNIGHENTISLKSNLTPPKSCLPINLPLHLSLTCEQDPELFQLLLLGQQLTPNLTEAIHRYPAEYHGLRSRGANFHLNHFRLCCTLHGRALMKPAELSSAKDVIWGHHNKPSPLLGCFWDSVHENHKHNQWSPTLQRMC